jgi:hypothetical protein
LFPAQYAAWQPAITSRAEFFILRQYWAGANHQKSFVLGILVDDRFALGSHSGAPMLKMHGSEMARIRKLIDELPAEVAAALSPALEPTWKARSRRMEARDGSIRVAVASF